MSTGKYFRGQGKFLRPDQEDFDDDSSEEEEEDQARPPPRNANMNLDDDDEDDDDDDVDEELKDDEEEEEEEEDDRKNKRKSLSRGGGAKKRHKASSFFDEEAQDDEDEDEDEDEPYGTHRDPHDVVKKHYTEEDIRREQMDEEARELIRQQDRRRAQAGRFGADNDDQSVAAMAQAIEDRHRMSRRPASRSFVDRTSVSERGEADEEGPVGVSAYAGVSQQALVPSVSDPSMWMVSCSNGKEEELVYQVMNKCIAFARQGKPLGITGCVAAQSKGKIYVESYSEPAVLEAIQGVRGLLPYSMRLIPINDMTTVMAVKHTKVPVKENEWVRMQRGAYKGDLALVKIVRESGQKCIVQFVPRLDWTLANLPPEEARVRRRTVRPPQKFFNAQDISALNKQPMRQRYPGTDIFCDFLDGNYYYDGYQLKEMTVGTMIKKCTDENPPTLDELQRFRKATKSQPGDYDDERDENEGSKLAGSLLDELSELQGKTGLGKTKKSTGAGLLIGDVIEVTEGDLVGVRGKLIFMDGSTVKVKPTTNQESLPSEIEFLASQVMKFIPVGAHVKVMDGRYANETGNVVAVEKMDDENDCTAVILTDVTNKEITVRTSQVRESAEVASGQDKLAGYELYDLVVLSGGGSSNEVGVIVRVGREDFTVINNHGIIREVRPEELRGKRNQLSNRAIAVDVQGNQIRVGDQVSVNEGPHKGKQATIKRMSRTQLFLYSQTRTENAGIFVVRSRSCMLAGSKTQNRSGTGDNGASPFVTPRQAAGGGGGRGKRDDALIGKSVRIQAGQWKGYIGTVSDATATHVQVELHSRLKKVMVSRERVVVAGDKFGSMEDPSRTSGQPSMLAPSTPYITGGATPMHGGATPMHGGATPMHDSTGGGEEVWRPGGTLDQDPAENTIEDGWGSAANNESNPFGSSEDSGWGSSSGAATWAPPNLDSGPSTASTSVTVQSSIKEEGATAGQIKRENIEAGAMGSEVEETPVWFMERVCVKMKNGESTGVIKDISGKTATIELEGGSSNNVSVGDIAMIEPKEHDIVLVTGGADVGVEGELVCIDGNDAILKDANEDFKIVDFVHLAKIASEA